MAPVGPPRDEETQTADTAVWINIETHVGDRANIVYVAEDVAEVGLELGFRQHVFPVVLFRKEIFAGVKRDVTRFD